MSDAGILQPVTVSGAVANMIYLCRLDYFPPGMVNKESAKRSEQGKIITSVLLRKVGR